MENSSSLIRHCLTLEKPFPPNLPIQEMISQHRRGPLGGKGYINAVISAGCRTRAVVPLSGESAVRLGRSKEAADPLLVIAKWDSSTLGKQAGCIFTAQTSVGISMTLCTALATVQVCRPFWEPSEQKATGACRLAQKDACLHLLCCVTSLLGFRRGMLRLGAEKRSAQQRGYTASVSRCVLLRASRTGRVSARTRLAFLFDEQRRLTGASDFPLTLWLLPPAGSCTETFNFFPYEEEVPGAFINLTSSCFILRQRHCSPCSSAWPC